MLSRNKISISCMLKVLSLLKTSTLTFQELLDTEYFPSKSELGFTLHTLTKTGCIQKLATNRYVIMDSGVRFLDSYPGWEVRCRYPPVVNR